MHFHLVVSVGQVDLREKLIYEEQRKWDIDREDFNGYDNYVIKRHPLEKWQSEEYKKLKKELSQEIFDLQVISSFNLTVSYI